MKEKSKTRRQSCYYQIRKSEEELHFLFVWGFFFIELVCPVWVENKSRIGQRTISGFCLLVVLSIIITFMIFASRDYTLH